MGYALDSKSIIRIQNFEFVDSFETLSLSSQTLNAATVLDRLTALKDFIILLDSSTNKGFLTTYDISKFPIFQELLPSFLTTDDSYKNGLNSMEGYKWVYNVIILNLYLFSLESIQTPENVIADVLIEFQNISKALLLRLDSSIRTFIQKRGIGIKENVYTGFDTEYTQTGSDVNKLVSSQLAVSCKTYIQIPTVRAYRLSRLDEQSNKIIHLKHRSNEFNYIKVENSIKQCVTRIRMLRYGKYDLTLKVLVEAMRMVKGISYYESEDMIVFSLPRSAIQPLLVVGDSFSFKELVEFSSSLARPFCEQQGGVLLDLLSHIGQQGFSLDLGMDKMLDSIYNTLSSFDEVDKLSLLSGEVLGYLTPESPGCNSVTVDKSVRRITKNISEKVSVTITRTYYIIGHLTPADLGQLSDFESIKEELTIVNGSFVTLGKAMKFLGRNVHVRDTMLLAPGGSKALSVIGGMYPNFPKLKITTTDLENMQGYLEREREKFVEYALRDAVITLVHASWMEDFNFSIGGLGVPISLSSIGRKYVKSV
jgi:hypothetical protein